jgi:DMSO reductase anchor subunit|tara:strand:- start:29074 stop:29319 length:246 start_codon:yes stop_codon:yes gene_type:complete
MANPHGQFEWKRRRRIIYAALIFCALEVAYLTVLGTDSALNATIVTSLILLAGSIIGTYVFGAVWDDLNARKLGGGGDGEL